MKKITFILILLIFAVSYSFLYADEIRYITQIKPIFEQRCANCHGADSPELPEFKKDKLKYKKMGRGPRMDSYTYLLSFIGWPDSGAIMRRLDDGKGVKDGKPGNMYQSLGSNEEERQKNLKLFREWVGNWTLKRWTEITKEDISGIKVKY